MKWTGYFLFLIILVSCNTSHDNNNSTLIDFSKINDFNKEKVNVDNLFDKFKLIELETNEESLIGGRAVKVIKKNNSYYVTSFNHILKFDSNGKFENRIIGGTGGPGDYGDILDFDVVPEKNSILISGIGGLYDFSADSLKFRNKVEYPTYLSKFKYIGEDKIIARTPDEKVFQIFDLKGNLLDAYFDKEMALSGQKIVDFIKIDNIYLSQLDNTNQAVAYNPVNSEFKIIDIINPSENLISMEKELKIFQETDEFEFMKRINDTYTGISSFRELKGQYILILNHPEGVWSMVCIPQEGSITNNIYFPDARSTIINNIISQIDPRYLNTMISTESDDSFIFIMDSLEEEENPSLLEVFSIK